ncbi:MAG TPA: flagellar hook assembly protein FlgD [Polyangiaceae bacterium]
MVDSISGSGTTTAAPLTSSLAGNKAMGRDEFLKLLVAQLRNQDPLKPQDGAQFVAELAQFSSLEQSMGINERLDLMMAQTRGLANTEVVSLVGKQATVKGSILTIDGGGAGAPLNFTLAGPAEETVVSIRDQNGRLVRTLDVGAKSAGMVRMQWDGRDDTGVVQPAGAYVVTIDAKSSAGTAVSVTQETTSVVEGVSFDAGYPVLHLANGVKAPVSDLLKVATAK